jgi:hypothetical protein
LLCKKSDATLDIVRIDSSLFAQPRARAADIQHMNGRESPAARWLVVLSILVRVPPIQAASEDGPPAAAFTETLREVELARSSLGERFAAAGSADGRARVRARARRFVVATIVDAILPAWIGTPWTMATVRDGLRPDARRPHQPGSGVSCSWFVVAVLRNAGLRLSDARAFAGGIALDLQRSTVRGRGALHRFWGLTPERLERELVELGDGLYLIGLSRHVGFVHVGDGRAVIIHSSPDGGRAVVREPVARSAAIELSAPVGYLVTPLFDDDRLIDHWLTGQPLPFAPARRAR